jgi:hypothetical protein
LLLTTEQLINFSQDELIKEIINDENGIVIKNEIISLKKYKFYVKNSEPRTGIITKLTELKLENREILNILKLQIAVIQSNVHEYDFNEDKNYQNYIHQQYFKPYFLSGVKRYIEKGDSIKIDNIEFFILNCYPDEGFVASETQLYYKYNMNKEKCMEKIEDSDMKLALQLARQFERESLVDSTYNNTSLDNNSTNNIYISDENRFMINSNNISEFISRIINRDIVDRGILSNAIQQNMDEHIDNDKDIELFICNLPEFVVDETYLRYIEDKKVKVENITKCMICFCEFEKDQILKTLPCSKIYLSYSYFS